MSLLGLQPLPTHEQYRGGFEYVREQLAREGGVQSVLLQRAMAAEVDGGISDNDKRIRELAALIANPSLGIDGDAAIQVQEAYINGYRVAEGVANYLYTSPFTTSDYLIPAHKWRMLQKPPESTDDHEEYYSLMRHRIITFGQRGLLAVGSDAQEILQDIAGEAQQGSDELQASFMLGSGALILGAESIQRAANETLLRQFGTYLDSHIDGIVDEFRGEQ